MKTVETGTEQFSAPELILSWESPTRRFEKKSKLWFFGLIVIFLAVFIFLVIFREYLFGLLILSFGALLFVQSAVKPPLTTYYLFSSGIQISGKMYLWEDLESFFIDEETQELRLKTGLSFPSEFTLLLEKGKEEEIRNVLKDKLPYVELKRTDYSSVFDGFITRFSEKIPQKFTRKFVKNPNEDLTVNPESLQKKVRSFKMPSLKLKKKKDATPNK